ncbi:30S ribosomal protein S11 [Candidatus Vidania fulgoroideorum]
MINIINVNTRYNNTIIVVSDLKGNVIHWNSPGKNKFRGSKKSTPFAIQTTMDRVCYFLKSIKSKMVILKFKGVGQARDPVIRSIINNNISVNRIIDNTSPPHNGCRPKKKRRV